MHVGPVLSKIESLLVRWDGLARVDIPRLVEGQEALHRRQQADLKSLFHRSEGYSQVKSLSLKPHILCATCLDGRRVGVDGTPLSTRSKHITDNCDVLYNIRCKKKKTLVRVEIASRTG